MPRLLLAVATLATAIAFLEGGARLIGLQAGFFLRPNRDECQQRSALLSIEFIPDCRGELASTVFRTNALGLRGPELRHDDSVRVLAAGDSCTWGWGVKERRSYPAVLQRILDARRAPRPYQVINAGVPGYTSYQGLLYLRERGLALEPEIVILNYGFNDLFKTGDIEMQLARMPLWMPFLRLDDFLIDTSTFYRWLRWTWHRRAPQDLPVRATAEQYRRNLTQMVELSRARGAKVLLVSFWTPVLGGPYEDALQAVASELSVPLLSYRGPTLDGVHPTAGGDRQLAAEIARRLEEAGYL